MSRSALWRQEVNVKERERVASENFQTVVEEGRNNAYNKGVIPLHGPDDTFNINPMLLANITKSSYFQKCCSKLRDWNAVVDEIYYKVTHVEPWTPDRAEIHRVWERLTRWMDGKESGATKMPSTAFCLLLRLLTLRCTEKQMNLMLHHVDSPYIRCVGFLYLRYACEPERIWEWFEPYLYDDEPVQVHATGTKPETTIGAWVRSLLTEMNYHDTLLPRLPVQIERNVKVQLLQAEQNEERAKQHLQSTDTMEFLQMGASVRALYADEYNPTAWYDCVIDKIIHTEESEEELSRPKFQVTFSEYGNTEIVTLGEIDLRPPPLEHEQHERAPPDYRRSRDYHRPPVASSTRNAADPSRGYPHERPSHHSHPPHHHHHDRRRDHSSDNTNRDHRAYSSSHRHTSSSSTRSENTEQNLMEEVLRREREKSAAKGKAYASRPATFKESLSIQQNPSCADTHNAPSSSHRHGKKRSHSDNKPMYDLRDAATIPNAPRQKSVEELAAIQEKKRKLLQKYG